MGVIPVPFGHGSPRTSDGCRLCAEMRLPGAGLGSALPELRHTVPLAFAALAGLLLIAIDRGPAGWLGGGAAAGIAACAIYVWSARRSLLRSAHEAHARELQELAEDADSRVELVVKQFEWAVGDVAKLRHDRAHGDRHRQSVDLRPQCRRRRESDQRRSQPRQRIALGLTGMARSTGQAESSGTGCDRLRRRRRPRTRAGCRRRPR